MIVSYPQTSQSTPRTTTTPAMPTRRASTAPATPEPSLQTVGELSVFRISYLWQVPMLLPRAYWDYSFPDVTLSRLVDGAQLCVAGVPCETTLMSGRSRISSPPPSPFDPEPFGLVDAPDPDQPEPTSCTQDSGGVHLLTLSPQEVESSDHSEAAVPDTASEDAEDDVELSDAETDSEGADEIGVWNIRIVSPSTGATLDVEMSEQTAATRRTITAARAGLAIYLFGTVSQVASDAFRLVDAEPVDVGSTGRIHARYPSKTTTTMVVVKPKRKSATKPKKPAPPKLQKVIKRYGPDKVSALIAPRMRLALPKAAQHLRDRLQLLTGPQEWDLLAALESKAPNFESLLWQAHYPSTVEQGQQAVCSLVRLVAFDLLLKVSREGRHEPHPDNRVRCTPPAYQRAVAELKANAGIVMTHEQDLACRTIVADLASPYRMRRMLSGDVGSGKTLVFGVAAATACAAGALVVILEPRSDLAQQIYRKLKSYWPHMAMRLVAGDTRATDVPKAGLVIGTTGVWSLIEDSGASPNLIIVDEQQKMGTAQRQPWDHRHANLLEATATPIPRTLALLQFGGMSVTTLEGTHTTKTVTTTVIDPLHVDSVYDFVSEQVRQHGKNLILVYSRIDAEPAHIEVPDGPCASIEKALPAWRDAFGDLVGVAHARMDQDERSAALADFESGKTKILLATSIVEVGIDFKEAWQMVVHLPERFGISAVHQLRGRLVRQGGEGSCYLAVGKNVTVEQLHVIKMMETETNGVKLSMADAIRRGIGDLRSNALQQSGDYRGFLVDRSPEVSDLQWVTEHCESLLAPEDAADDPEEGGLNRAFIERLAQAPLTTSVAKRPKAHSTPPAASPQQLSFNDLFG